MMLFCDNLKEYMESDKFRKFVSLSRIPNERELYSVFVKSILESCDPKDLGHIASEFQVGLGDDAKGRADLLFNYRSVGFLFEIKAGTLSARRLGNLTRDNEPRKNVRQKWERAVEQLENLNISSVERVMKKKIVKIPFAIYFHYAFGDELEEVNAEKVHRIAEEFISDNDKKYTPDFSFYVETVPPVRTRTRRLQLNQDPNINLYGVSIFGKQLNEEIV